MTAAVVVGLGSGQAPAVPPQLPVVSAEACRIEFGIPQLGWSAWSPNQGGTIAFYDLRANDQGIVESMTRRPVAGREHLERVARLDQFEDCMKRWRLDGAGEFIASIGIARNGDGAGWAIQVWQKTRRFRLLVAVERSED